MRERQKLEKEDSRNYNAFWLLSGVFVFVLAFRIAYSIPIEISIDTISRWYIPTVISRTGEWSLLAENIWTARWGITLPQTLISYLIPGRIEGYYLLPLLSYSFATAALAVILVRYANTRVTLVLAFCTLVTLDPLALAWASQLSEQPVALFYVVSSLYVFLRYIESNRITYLIVAIVLCFCSYGVHILFGIVFVPLLCVLLVRQQYKIAVFSIAIYALLFLFENYGLYLLSEGRLSLGRLSLYPELLDHSLMMSVKDQLDEDYVPQDILFTISRWIVLPKFNQLIVVLFLIVCTFQGYQIYRSKKFVKPLQLLLILFPLTYAIEVTFLPKSIVPFQSLLDLTDKYQLLFMPFAAACTCETVSRFSQSYIGKKSLDAVIGVISILGLIIYIVASHTIGCGPTVWQDDWKLTNVIHKSICSGFRISRGENTFPMEPEAFVLTAHSTYSSIYRVYDNGEVGVPRNTRGYFWIAIFNTLDEKRRRGFFVKDFLSSDGEMKQLCVDEITTQEPIHESYVKCTMAGIAPLGLDSFNVLIEKTVLRP